MSTRHSQVSLLTTWDKRCRVGWLALIANLTQHNITWGGPLTEGLSRLGHPVELF